MTPEAINMAELDGWTRRPEGTAFSCWRHPENPHCKLYPNGGVGQGLLPKYTEDLNAVASVVRALSDMDLIVYQSILAEMCHEPPYAIDALPAARCEAILRATGKWVES